MSIALNAMGSISTMSDLAKLHISFCGSVLSMYET